MGASWHYSQKGDPHYAALHSAAQFPTAQQRGSHNQELLMLVDCHLAALQSNLHLTLNFSIYWLTVSKPI